jgi:hypothetical protein
MKQVIIVKAQSGRVIPLIDIAEFSVIPTVRFHKDQIRWGIRATLHTGEFVLLYMTADFDTESAARLSMKGKNYEIAKKRMDELVIAHKLYMKSVTVIEM